MNQEKRYLKIILLQGFLLACFVIGIVSWASVAVKDLRIQNSDLASKILSQSQDLGFLKDKLSSIKIINGTNGRDGQDGANGKNGQDSMSTTTIITVPEKGEQGEPGKDGASPRDIEFSRNAAGQVDKYRYIGDRDWQEIPVRDE